MERNRVIRIIAFILFLAGVCIFLLPVASQKLFDYKSRDTLLRFDSHISLEKSGDTDNGAMESLYQIILAYNANLFQSGQSNLNDPFSYEQVEFSLMDFGFEEELIGYVTIPQMDLQLPIYLGANADNMKRGAAHLTQTSIPVGGVNSNAVICAHRGMGTAKMFRDIHLLELDDVISLTNFRETLHYQVVDIQVIQPQEVEKILIQPNRDLLTLLTCHPYGYNSQRYVVICERIAQDS